VKKYSNGFSHSSHRITNGRADSWEANGKNGFLIAAVLYGSRWKSLLVLQANVREVVSMVAVKRKITHVTPGREEVRKKRELWDDFKPGVFVKDKWYADQGIGTIINRLKTVVYIQFREGVLKYDRPHATQFLQIQGPPNGKQA
jgi:hypothetical protein